MELISFSIEEKESKKTGKKYYVFVANCKNGDKYMLDFARKI